MEIGRRTFLTGITTLVGGLVIAKDNPVKLVTDFCIPESVQRIKNIRIMCQYEVDFDEYVVRYDFWDKVNNNMFCCSAIFQPSTVKDYMIKVHNPIVSKLNSFVNKNKIYVSNLCPLNLPTGYKHPDIMVDILKSLRYTV